MKRRILTFVLAVFILINVPAFAKDVSSLEEKTFDYIISNVSNPQHAQVGGEWSVIGVARSEREISAQFFDAYYNNLAEILNENAGVLHERKYTEYARAVLALTAIGKDPADINGYNLISCLEDYESVIYQGTNGAAYALLALDSNSYSVSDDIREKYIAYILSKQQENGGFSLGSGEADVDITAMCLCALSKYKDRAEISASVEKALIYLSLNQNDDGGFSSFGVENAESTMQVIMALCELNEEITQSAFVKNSNTLIDNLASYSTDDGGFYHTKSDKNVSLMTTEQAYYTLVNLKRVSENKSSLYSMNDIKGYESIKETESKEYKIPEITMEKSFDDISDSKNKEAILNLSGRGILNGKEEKLFYPDDKVTRAEFSAIIVRALGLTGKSDIKFSDVNKEDWFFESVSVAFDKKLINGTSETTFNPHGFITKQEAAAITARTFEILSLRTEMSEDEIRNILSQFEDYLTCEDWALNSLALLYDKDILSQSDMLIEPYHEVTRGEIAEMIFGLIRWENEDYKK